MMRLLAWATLLLAAPAAADDNKTSSAAGDAFARAEAADAKGKLDEAIDLYERSYRIAPHANTAYNLADALARKKSYTEAIVYYELYLALAPTAKDAAQVRKIITGLETRPTTFEIAGDGTDGVDLRPAYVIIDGAIAKKPGGSRVDVKLAPGYHTIDIVTPDGVAWDEVEVRRTGGTKPYSRVPPVKAEGNVIISTSVVEAVAGKERIERSSAARLALPTGKQLVAVYDGRRECAPITIDVKAGKVITYVHIALATPDQSSRGSLKFPERCRKLRVTQRALTGLSR